MMRKLTLGEFYLYLRVSKRLGDLARKCVDSLILESAVPLSKLLTLWACMPTPASMPVLSGTITVSSLREEEQLDSLKYQSLTVIYLRIRLCSLGKEHPVKLIRQAIQDHTKTLVLKDLNGIALTFKEGYMPHPAMLHSGLRDEVNGVDRSLCLYDRFVNEGLTPQGIRCDSALINLISKYQEYLPIRLWVCGFLRDVNHVEDLRRELPGLIELRADYPMIAIRDLKDLRYLEVVKGIVFLDCEELWDRTIALPPRLKSIGVSQRAKLF